jgi:all-trans-8'-apo-beta-carotenal 15,15'-oxygenase
VQAADVLVHAFRPVDEEVATELPVESGAVPAGLRGTLYRNGAGRLEVHGVQQMHPFDGDGMVSRFAFEAGGVHYRNRYVQTQERVAEARAGRMLYRGFGTNLPGGLWRNALRMRFKNAANTSVVVHGGRLLALWEAGLPHALDPNDLSTLGRWDFDGELRKAGSWLSRWVGGETPFSAHPKVDSRTGELHNFGLLVGPRPELLLYRVGADGRLRDTRSVPLAEACFLHDFVITETYAVFFATPIRFDVPRALSGLSTPVESIRRDPARTTEVILVPHDGGPVQRRSAETGFFLFHYFDAYDDGPGRVVVHGCRMDDFVGGTIDLRDARAIRQMALDPAFPTRWVIDLNQDPAVQEERLSEVPMELPFVDRRRTGLGHRFGFATARTSDDAILYNGLARIDFATGDCKVRDFGLNLPGEPVFVPRSPAAPEGEGWLLCLVYLADRHRTELQVLDASDLSTLARLPLPHHQLPGFHGCFVPAEND